MSNIVIESGVCAYYLASGMISRDEFPLKSLIKKFILEDSGFLYFEDDGTPFDSEEVLGTLKAISILMNEKMPKLNRVKS